MCSLAIECVLLQRLCQHYEERVLPVIRGSSTRKYVRTQETTETIQPITPKLLAAARASAAAGGLPPVAWSTCAKKRASSF